MRQFILLTFGFLGLAFYEMSGGSDFEPGAPKALKVNPLLPTVETAATKDELKATRLALNSAIRNDATPTAPDTITGGADVTPVALNLTRVRDSQSTPLVGGEASDFVQKASLTTRSTLSSADTPAIFSKKDEAAKDGDATLQSAVAVRPEFEKRVVTGNRVNVRGGPGTQFGVVDQLSRGAAVEILRDNGQGWVKMRSVSDGRIGWMADFLLAAS